MITIIVQGLLHKRSSLFTQERTRKTVYSHGSGGGGVFCISARIPLSQKSIIFFLSVLLSIVRRICLHRQFWDHIDHVTNIIYRHIHNDTKICFSHYSAHNRYVADCKFYVTNSFMAIHKYIYIYVCLRPDMSVYGHSNAHEIFQLKIKKLLIKNIDSLKAPTPDRSYLA